MQDPTSFPSKDGYVHNNPLHEPPQTSKTNVFYKSKVNKSAQQNEKISSHREAKTSTVGQPAISNTKTEATGKKNKFFAKMGQVRNKIANFVQNKFPNFGIKDKKAEVIGENSQEAFENFSKVIHGILTDNEKVTVSASNTEVELPTQFNKDLHRMNSISIGPSYTLKNDSKKSKTALTDEKRPEVHQKILELVDNNPEAARNVEIMLSQQMTDSLLLFAFNKAQALSIDYQPSGGEKLYSVQEKDGNIHVGLTMMMGIIDTSQGIKRVAYMGMKREIIIPKEQLNKEVPQLSKGQSMDSLTELFPGIKIIDHATPVVPVTRMNSERAVKRALFRELESK